MFMNISYKWNQNLLDSRYLMLLSFNIANLYEASAVIMVSEAYSNLHNIISQMFIGHWKPNVKFNLVDIVRPTIITTWRDEQNKNACLV